MTRLFSSPRFLVIYSATVTLAFILTVAVGLTRGPFSPATVSAAAQKDWSHPDFDQLTVHRINIVEPDGTPRLIISNKSEYPGSFFHGKEIARPDRDTSAGFLFINDEGTENGGLIFGGYKSKDGQLHSWGHLSFDEYQQDQAMALDMSQDGTDRESKYQINDNGPAFITPDAFNAIEAARSMPRDTPAQRDAAQKALSAALDKYPIRIAARASLERTADMSAALRLRDPQGRTRILLHVAADGTPAMQFLDAAGKITQQWPAK
jgi:hypothetical protein